ncbi:MAG TPA: ATP-binding protein [Steroidobacteraceae bacterium]|nr:ATP-binding protein [Steroidobacteraceae bacterium]
MNDSRRHSSELQALLDATVDAVILIDGRGLIEVCNHSAERLFGYRDTEMLGRNVSMLMTSADRDHHDGYLQRYRETGVAKIIGIGREVVARRKDGTVFPAFLSVGRIDRANPPRFVGFLQDLTLREQALVSAREARERMMHVSRLATMGEMATGIAHEINQPLAAITAFAQACRRLLAQPNPDLPEIDEALEQIAAQSLRAGEIIRRLRSLVRNRETQREPASINALIEELGTLTRADARMHDVRVTLDLAPDMPIVDLDTIQVQQVLLNLVRNAVQALQFTTRERDISIATRHEGDEIVVRVRDSGPGVTSAIAGRLFQPFSTTKSDGTGLGLAISRTIIEAHRGTLQYEPDEQGTCFVIRIPASNPASESSSC